MTPKTGERYRCRVTGAVWVVKGADARLAVMVLEVWTGPFMEMHIQVVDFSGRFAPA